jgi:cytochrome c
MENNSSWNKFLEEGDMHKPRNINPSPLALAALLFSGTIAGMSGRAEAAFTYPGCTDLAATDFKDVVLVNQTIDPTLNEPISLSVGKDGRVFFTERASGYLKMIDLDGKVKTMGKFDVNTGNELGLRFVSPDPDFATNRWLYLMMTPQNPHVKRLARVHVKADWTVDMATVKPLIDMPWTYETCCHQGGAIGWDAFGNMYVSTGNNKNNFDDFSVTDDRNIINDNGQGTANTMDWRGKIIRIKPISFPDGETPAPGIGKTYGIPAGNLREFYTAKGHWGAGDQAKILPEIYTMGHRNPYSMNVDPYTGWVSWGDIGPDAGQAKADRGPAGNDEFNLIKEPGFMGWPYFVGANLAYQKWDYVNDKSLNQTWDVNAPMNTSALNTGVQKLPPAKPAILPESKQQNITPLLPQGGGTAAISGPVYHYDGSNPSTRKLPPHFDGKWIIGEFADDWLKVATPDAGLTKINDLQAFPGGLPGQNRIIGLDLGPDGALYYLNYAGWASSTGQTKIGRLEYTGSCRPATPVPHLPTVALRDKAPKAGLVAPGISNGRLTLPAGVTGVELYDLAGKLAFRKTRTDATRSEDVVLPQGISRGVLRAVFTNP